MNLLMTTSRGLTCAAVLAVGLCSASLGTDVLPTIGGDQASVTKGAPMKHIAIAFDGSDLHVHLDQAVATPLLRVLSHPNQFNAAEAWAVLDSKHHNFQYGWVPDGIFTPPQGSAVWIEPLTATPGLEVFEGGRFMSEQTIRAMTFEPIFGTSGSNNEWKWSGVMTHNSYAVVAPNRTEYEATYRVYFGDETTGVELADGAGMPLYGSDDVTLTFAIPVPEPDSFLLLLASCFPLGAARRLK